MDQPIDLKSSSGAFGSIAGRRALDLDAVDLPVELICHTADDRVRRASAIGSEWRTGLLKRRHGLNRCRNKGSDGMKRSVGLGFNADNLINIGLAMNAAASH